jgi:thioredoxin-dependent peroxiredoxin
MLKIGDLAPDFALESRRGVRRLSDAKGKYAVVYFYPRDNTPGCTREGQAFSRAARAFTAAGAVVYGISKDSVESHDRFADTCDITVDLLSDADLKAHKAYGAFGEKTMYGKKVVGTIRSTFIVDPSGHVAEVFPQVKVDGHADAVLEAIVAMKGATKGVARRAGTAKPRRTSVKPARKTGAR